jgi:S1/P1 Nuclease
MRTFRLAAASLTLLCAIAAADRAAAWGDLGHKIVCEIAFQELNDQARQEVRRLIRLDPEFTLFSHACTWPDHPRKRANEHFINVPRDFERFVSDECVGTSQCLLTAISADLLLLQTSTDDEAKLAALKFLGHWIGDIHQPLHVSFEDDRGGGKIKESGPCSNNLPAYAPIVRKLT